MALARSSSGSPAPAVSSRHYLLALGDSLAAGYQPTDGASPPPKNPATGYPDAGYPGSYASDIASNRGLDLIDLACPGETTASMTSTPAEAACASAYKAEFGVANQITAAKAFLAAHRSQVAIVTFDLGANDIDGCADSGGVSLSCINAGESRIAAQLPAIVGEIRQLLKTDDPKALFVAMNYYDPFLGAAYSPGGLTGSLASTLSVGAAQLLNTRLATIYAHDSVPVADVAAAFSTSKLLPMQIYGGHKLPFDVAEICRLTWMCPLPGSAQKANIHATTVGYRVIARTFEKILSTGTRT